MKKTYITSAMIMALTLASMTGCGESSVSQNSSSSVKTATSVSETKESVTAEKSTEYIADENNDTIEVKKLSNETEATTYTQRDLEQTADTSDAQNITVADGQIIDITSEGVYTISGSAENCTIRINAEDTAKVQLVLDGVNIENEDFPAIYVLSADKVFITTTDSDNTLTVSGQFTADGENNTDAVIYSKDDLVLNGTGTLNITSVYGNGITSKDDMKITGGTYNVTSALDAFEANDSISVNDGIFSITSNKDGFHCENDEGEGSVNISGGSFTINGGSDGIQACAVLQIDGGTLDITASEGIEATYIVINDGNIYINASDDGINASASSNAYETAIVFNGGNVNVTMGQGDTDAIDSNGSIYVNGGTINVTAQMSSFDYDGIAEFNGGTIIVNGQEVSEITQSMMGGGMIGGMNGNMSGGFGGGRGGRF